MTRIFQTAAMIIVLLAAIFLMFAFSRSPQQQKYPPFNYIPIIAAPEAVVPVIDETPMIDEAPSSVDEDIVVTPPAPPAPLEPAAVSPEVIEPGQIVKAAEDLMRGESIEGIYTMTIRTPGWQRSLRLKVTGQGRDKMFIRILAPAKEAGIGSLRIDHEMWNYLPDIEKTLKIPPSMMLQPWMGSDFANDDLVKESSVVNDYTHTLLSIDNLDGHTAYKIELTPKPEAAVIWGRRVQWIRLGDNVPLKEEYYDENGEIIKVLDYSNIGTVSDRVIPRTWTMTSLTKQGHYTVIELINVHYNLPVKNHVFTLQNLKKIQ
jgi:outer membrane lipoprotein-sorting protein